MYIERCRMRAARRPLPQLRPRAPRALCRAHCWHALRPALHAGVPQFRNPSLVLSRHNAVLCEFPALGCPQLSCTVPSCFAKNALVRVTTLLLKLLCELLSCDAWMTKMCMWYCGAESHGCVSQEIRRVWVGYLTQMDSGLGQKVASKLQAGGSM